MFFTTINTKRCFKLFTCYCPYWVRVRVRRVSDSPPPPPPASIMVGLTDDLPILLETGLDCPSLSLSLLSCLGRDLESPAETQENNSVTSNEAVR